MYMNKLSSAERMRRFYNGQIIDRVPVFSCATMYAGWEKGLTSEEFYFDVAKAFQAQKELYEEGYDDLPCYDLPHGEILDFGGELIINQTGRVSLPFVKRFPIDSLEEAWKYELPPMSERRYTKYYVKFLEYAEKQGQMGVSISAGSPFTMIGSMVDTGLLMRWLVKEPDVVHHLLNIAINYLNESADLLIQKFGIERCSVSSNYPFESNCLISPKIFEKYAYPSMLKIHKDLRLKGLENFGIHLCGNHDKNMKFFKDLNLAPGSFISSDEANSLKVVAEIFGKDYIYAGNVSTKLLVNGTKQQVYQQSKNLIEEMRYNNFILMPSCDLPINTKAENLAAMLEASCDFSK